MFCKLGDLPGRGSTSHPINYWEWQHLLSGMSWFVGIRDCVDDSVVDSIRTLESIGNKPYETFKKIVFDDRTTSIHDPIKKNSLSGCSVLLP